MKICRKCKKKLDLSAYYKNLKTVDSTSHVCKKCRNLKQKNIVNNRKIITKEFKNAFEKF